MRGIGDSHQNVRIRVLPTSTDKSEPYDDTDVEGLVLPNTTSPSGSNMTSYNRKDDRGSRMNHGLAGPRPAPQSRQRASEQVCDTMHAISWRHDLAQERTTREGNPDGGHQERAPMDPQHGHPNTNHNARDLSWHFLIRGWR